MNNGVHGRAVGPRPQDRARVALSAIEEMLVRLQELGDLAGTVRDGLPRHRARPRPPVRSGPPPEEVVAGQRKLALTGRQGEVLELLAQGLSNRRISRTLHIAEQTVKAHLHMIYRKLGVADRTEAVVVAMRRGLVPGAPVRVPLPRHQSDAALAPGAGRVPGPGAAGGARRSAGGEPARSGGPDRQGVAKHVPRVPGGLDPL
ncbi:response regulator transcription factor [Actinosynnema sp. NPDC059797]